MRHLIRKAGAALVTGLLLTGTAVVGMPVAHADDNPY